ncbi:MAG: diaminopimelate epimerase [Nocardioides sp.]|uniref:diaminopimelate epimerase n=1 Tax=Nocardioides sp. TaxID=35761 RepID=UPI002636035E|nr:diaminopimelate epimerase [Nocardioides sp.]MCW2832185.1 diaminopimelate epimerase [Nocardioides sp.]
MTYRFLKGHGTENDFVLLPDADGSVHGDLSAERVRALCDRRSGIGGDGVLRAVRRDDRWFMDYRNADGSISEMCGNGIRVFARYLLEHEGESSPLEVASRDGVRTITREGDAFTVDMGSPEVFAMTKVGVEGVSHPALHVSTGNPHAVAFVDSLDVAGTLLEEPDFDRAVYPDGVNVEFVVRRGPHHVAMRVHERGSGETRSCGTGACAVMVASALADDAPRGTTYRVDVPGGSLEITWTEDHRMLMTGPAVLVAEGTTDL